MHVDFVQACYVSISLTAASHWIDCTLAMLYFLWVVIGSNEGDAMGVPRCGSKVIEQLFIVPNHSGSIQMTAGLIQQKHISFCPNS